MLEQCFVQIYAKQTGNQSSVGTGYAIGNGLILTARHVILHDPAKPLKLVFPKIGSDGKHIIENSQYIYDRNSAILFTNDNIIFQDSEFDIAIIRCPVKIDSPEVTLATKNPSSHDNWLTHGFPRAGQTEHQRDKEPFLGNITDEETEGRFLRLQTSTLLNKDNFSVDVNGWSGLSGAPVFVSNNLVGVITKSYEPAYPSVFQAVSIPYLLKNNADFKNKVKPQIPHQSLRSKLKFNKWQNLENADYRVAFVNRDEQCNHIKTRIIETDKTKKTFAFIIAGVKEEWPEALKTRLNICLELPKQHPVDLDLDHGNDADFWCSLLENISELKDSDNLEDLSAEDLKKQLQAILSDYHRSLLFYFSFKYNDVSKYKNLDRIKFIVQSWEDLQLAESSCQHILLIINSDEEKGKGFKSKLYSIFNKGGEQKVEKLRQNIAKKLGEFPISNDHPKIVVPQLKSPETQDINHWSNELDGYERSLFDKDLEKKKKPISLLAIRDSYNAVFNQNKPKS